MQAARRFGVRAVPAFFVVDGQGGVVDAQVGIPNRARLGAQAEALLAK
jgi:protein-disulfide isomerase